MHFPCGSRGRSIVPGRPKVSIVVPAYNAQEYLADCLTSLERQQLSDIEVICVNDGSTDDTLSVMRSFADRDSRFRVIDKQNTGYGHSMNVGFDAMRGDWFASVDSDDEVTPAAYMRMLEVAQQHNLDFVKADRAYFKTDGDVRVMSHSGISRSASSYGCVLNPSANPWLSGVKPGQPGLYRASFLRENGIRHNETPGASFQDTGFYAQVLFHAKRVMLIDEELYLIREDNPNRSTLDSSKVFSLSDEHDFIRQKALAISDEGQRDVCLKAAAAMRFDGYRWNETRLSMGDLESFVRRSSREFAELKNAGELNPSLFSEAEWVRLNMLIDYPMQYFAMYCCMRGQDNGPVSPRSEVARLQEQVNRQRADSERLKGQLASQKDETARLAARVKKLESCNSYRIGRVVTWPIRMVKRATKSWGKHE